MRPLRGLTWGGTAYIIATIGLGLVFVPVAWWLHPISPAQFGELLYLSIATQLASLMPLRWQRGQQTVDTLPLVATGLAFPGAGPAIVAWLFVFDGRHPPETPLWRLIWVRARSVLEHGAASILVAALPISGIWALPVRTLIYSLLAILIAYPLTATFFAFLERLSFWEVLLAAMSLQALVSVVLLGFGGGVLLLLLQQPVGYLMGIAFLGFLVTIRSNMAASQRDQTAKYQTLELLADALDARDAYTKDHSRRVAELAVRIGTALELSPRVLDRLLMAGTLHDLGKIGVRDAVLNKPGPLAPDEWIQMRRHPEIGAEMIAKHSALADLAPSVRGHHERWDGSGYPDGLAGEQIPLAARVIGIADSFDTITGPRVYRPSAYTPAEAVRVLTRDAGRLFDPRVVSALREVHGLEGLAEMPPLEPDTPGQIRHGLDLYLHRPRFRALMTAMSISALGDPLTTIATLVTVYALTRSALAIAAAFVIRGVATLLVGAALTSITDRFNRRKLLVVTEAARTVVLVVTPIALIAGSPVIFVTLFFLSAADAIATPAREAAIPDLVRPGEVRAAVALLGMTTTGASVIGFPIAGIVLTLGLGTTPLFWLDAATFAAAGVLTFAAGQLGGAVVGRQLAGGLGVALRSGELRPLLLIAGTAGFFINMALPTLIQLAYRLSTNGPQALTVLETVLTTGIVLGNLLMGRIKQSSHQAVAATGLGIMGLFSIGISLATGLFTAAALLVIASVGNAMYFVANRAAIQEAAPPDARGTVMSIRYTMVQFATLLGAAAAGVAASAFGPSVTYGLLGAGLTLVATFAATRRLNADSMTVHPYRHEVTDGGHSPGPRTGDTTKAVR